MWITNWFNLRNSSTLGSALCKGRVQGTATEYTYNTLFQNNIQIHSYWEKGNSEVSPISRVSNSNTFSDWRRTCHVSLVKIRATTTWTFDSHVIRSCTFETAANLYASRRQANNFYLCIVLFWVGRYNKTLNDWPLGKQWVLFPLDLNVSLGFASGKQNSLFPLGPVIKCLLLSSLKPTLPLVIWRVHIFFQSLGLGV